MREPPNSGARPKPNVEAVTGYDRADGAVPPSAIDSLKARQLYSQRIGTVAPVFGNIRHNKRLTRLNLRGREKLTAQ